MMLNVTALAPTPLGVFASRKFSVINKRLYAAFDKIVADFLPSVIQMQIALLYCCEDRSTFHQAWISARLFRQNPTQRIRQKSALPTPDASFFVLPGKELRRRAPTGRVFDSISHSCRLASGTNRNERRADKRHLSCKMGLRRTHTTTHGGAPAPHTILSP